MYCDAIYSVTKLLAFCRCLSSQKVMDHYVRFAREASKEVSFGGSVISPQLLKIILWGK